MGIAVNGIYADVKLRWKISQALLRLNATKPGNEAIQLVPTGLVAMQECFRDWGLQWQISYQKIDHEGSYMQPHSPWFLH